MSRASILSAVKNNQPANSNLPDLDKFKSTATTDVLEQFCTVAQGVGSAVFMVKNLDEVKQFVQSNYSTESRKITVFPSLGDIADDHLYKNETDPHNFENVELAIMQAHFGVAENSALWVSDELLAHRVLPFICQHLAFVVSKKNMVATMHQAYDLIGQSEYGFGTFIAGPSKTADIEQSLVLGAHGPRSLTIFILED